MKILIVTAMKEELLPLLDNTKKENYNFVNSIYKKINTKNDIYMSNIGIGKVNSAFGITSLINILNPDLIVNFGTAGGVAKELEILDIVVATKTAYHDVDVTGFGYKKGQVPGQELYYGVKPDQKLINILEDQIIGINMGLIVSGDQFINDNNKTLEIEKQFDNVMAVEMESCAVVDVCHKLDKQVLIIRGISDLAHSDSTLEFDKYLEKVMEKFNNIIKILEEY